MHLGNSGLWTTWNYRQGESTKNLGINTELSNTPSVTRHTVQQNG